MHTITLRAGDLALDVVPSLGGAVLRFTSGDFPIFRETPATPASVSDCSSFPLIPFSNRIRAGRFHFDGMEYQIPVDKRDPRFTNHGHTRHLPWEVIASSATELTLRFTQAEPTAAWPFPFTAEQVFSLVPGRLTMRARIQNDFDRPAPAGIGFHPYFARLANTELGFSADCIWAVDGLDIPIRSEPPAGRFDFSTVKPLEAPLINNAYGGWNATAEIIHPSRFHITVSTSAALNHLILFTPEGKSFFGFEPVSHRPDALNPLSDLNDEGMAILAPGASLEGIVEITIASSKPTV